MQKVPGLELNVDIAMKGDNKMEKVNLTQEQENALYRFSSNSAVINKWFQGFESPYHKCLEKLSLDQLCRVLYTPGSYEVISEFIERDWITSKDGTVGRIQSIGNRGDLIGVWYSSPGITVEMRTSPGKQRYATPEEKKKGFWWSIGREVDEYRTGDIVFNESTKQTYQVAKGQLVPAKIVSCKLICPVEQRLDK